MLDQSIFLWIIASVADVAAVNPNGIKTLLANGFNTSNGPKSLPRNPPDCSVLWN